MKHHLTRFEQLARRLIEGTFSRLFGEGLAALDLPALLARAMEQAQVNGLAPDTYDILLHPDDIRDVQPAYPDLTQQLERYIRQLAQQADLVLVDMPEVRLQADRDRAPHQAVVQARFRSVVEPPTELHDVVPAAEAIQSVLAEVDAFVIVEGRRHLPLNRPMLTMGRRTDNDIVIDSPSVSRRHAQLRWRYGRFILTDLSGRGRTAVNGQPVTECALEPGDVITLSDVPLIYGEGRVDRRAGHVVPAAADAPEDTLLLPPRDEV